MEVPLELNEDPVMYNAVWSENTLGASSSVYRATGGKNSQGIAGAGIRWSTKQLNKYNTQENIAPFKVPKGYGAWFVSSGGGPAPCNFVKGHAVAWAWVPK